MSISSGPVWQDVEQAAQAIHATLARAGHVPRRRRPWGQDVSAWDDLPADTQNDYRAAARAVFQQMTREPMALDRAGGHEDG